jgi:hypothetical protein
VGGISRAHPHSFVGKRYELPQFSHISCAHASRVGVVAVVAPGRRFKDVDDVTEDEVGRLLP